MSEVYDEIVFTNPNESFFLDVLAIGDTPSIEQEYTQHQYFTKFSDTADMHALLEAQKFMQQQLQITKERYVRLNEELDTVEIEIDNAVMPPPPPPTPQSVTQPSSVASQSAQPSAPAPSKARSNAGASTKSRASSKGITKGAGTKNKAATQAPPLGGNNATGTGGKKAKTKNDNKNQSNATAVAATVTSSISVVATSTPTSKEKSTKSA